MESQFLSYITRHLPDIRYKKLLLAVSGGLDSMLLYHFCKYYNMDIAVAHCNFGLRATESDAETAFVKTTMQEAGVVCFSKHFDTYAYAKEKKISTQMAARELRYDWFQEVVKTEDFDYILTAHHINDSAETLLINLSRGTGIKGLMGVPLQNQNIVRPLLGFSRKQLKEYAIVNKIVWKEDSSNSSDAYLRNHLRHHAIPALEEASPRFLEGISKTQEHLKQSAALLKVYETQLKEEFTYPIKGASGFGIELEKLRSHPAPNAVLYALLEGYGFTAWKDIYALISAQSGKQVSSASHSILKDRMTLQVLPNTVSQENPTLWVEEGITEIIVGTGRLKFEEVKALTKVAKNEIFVDKSRLKFPLHIRSWQEGDYFLPLGLGGKKKLSKFFKDEKLSLRKKQEVQILCSDDEIVWLIGMRPDNRFKVTASTQTILKISCDTYEI